MANKSIPVAFPVIEANSRTMTKPWYDVINELVNRDTANITGVTTNPPAGMFAVTNLYVDSATGRLVVQYDDGT